MHNHALLIPKDTEGNNWERELKNQMILKFDSECKYFFFSYFIHCKQNADKSHIDRAQKYNAT